MRKMILVPFDEYKYITSSKNQTDNQSGSGRFNFRFLSEDSLSDDYNMNEEQIQDTVRVYPMSNKASP